MVTRVFGYPLCWLINLFYGLRYHYYLVKLRCFTVQLFWGFLFFRVTNFVFKSYISYFIEKYSSFEVSIILYQALEFKNFMLTDYWYDKFTYQTYKHFNALVKRESILSQLFTIIVDINRFIYFGLFYLFTKLMEFK